MPEEDYKDKYIRAVAEMSNMKKRLEKEKTEFKELITKQLLLDMLELADDFHSLYIYSQEKSFIRKSIREGIVAVTKKIASILSRNGVQLIEVGKEFDPNLHDAVGTIERAPGNTPGTICQCTRRGYTVHGKLLRPASVVVFK